MGKPLKILVIPDSHACCDNERLDRFDWVGKMIVDERPDIVVDIGDRADLPSLSTYDRGTKGFEGRRYSNDLAAIHEANRRLLAPLKKLQKKQKQSKRKVYKPELIVTLGNHEQRILRACSSSPELDGYLTYDDLQYEKDWKVFDFLEIVERGGVKFSHYFVSGIMGKAIGGVNSAKSHLSKLHCSTVSGHSHLFDYAEEVDAMGNRIQAMVVGWYGEDSPHWTNPQQYKLWSSGVVILDNVKNGTYDYKRVGIETMEKLYGNKS